MTDITSTLAGYSADQIKNYFLARGKSLIVVSNSIDRAMATQLVSAFKQMGFYTNFSYSSQVSIPFGYPLVEPELFTLFNFVVIVGGHMAPENTGNLVSPLLTSSEKAKIERPGGYGIFQTTAGLTGRNYFIFAGYSADDTVKAIRIITDKVFAVPAGEGKATITYFYPTYPDVITAKPGSIITICKVKIQNTGTAPARFRYEIRDDETKALVAYRETGTLEVNQTDYWEPSASMPSKDWVLSLQIVRIPDNVPQLPSPKVWKIALVQEVGIGPKGSIVSFDYTKSATPGKTIDICWGKVRNVGDKVGKFNLRLIDLDTAGVVWSRLYELAPGFTTEFIGPSATMPDKNWRLRFEMINVATGKLDDSREFTISKTVVAPTLVKVEVSPKEVTLEIGKSQAFSAVGVYSDGSRKAISATWSISPAIGTLSTTTGTSTIFTAKSSGTATIVATANGFKDTATIKVPVAIALESIRVSPQSMSMVVGETKSFGVIGRYTDGTEGYPTAEWSVDPVLGTFSVTRGPTTSFTATTPGTGRIIAKANGLVAFADITVSPKVVGATITGNVKDKELKPIIGATITLKGTGYTTSTDVNGNYSLSGIPTGNYTIEVSAPEYITVTKDISLPEAKTYSLDFTLEKAPPLVGIGLLAALALAGAGAYMLLKPKK